MKIAIPTENGYVCQHFGRSPYYTIVDIEDNKEIKRELIENPGHEVGVIPEFLNKIGANCIICSGIGSRAQEIFAKYNIETIMGAEGKIDDIIKNFISGKIESKGSACKH